MLETDPPGIKLKCALQTPNVVESTTQQATHKHTDTAWHSKLAKLVHFNNCMCHGHCVNVALANYKTKHRSEAKNLKSCNSNQLTSLNDLHASIHAALSRSWTQPPSMCWCDWLWWSQCQPTETCTVTVSLEQHVKIGVSVFKIPQGPSGPWACMPWFE